MEYKRADRVAVEIQRILSQLLLRGLKDPRCQDMTITSVKLSDDLKTGRVYFVGSKEMADEAIEGFNSASGFIYRNLRKELHMKFTPSLRFYFDDSFDYADKIESLLGQVREREGWE